MIPYKAAVGSGYDCSLCNDACDEERWSCVGCRLNVNYCFSCLSKDGPVEGKECRPQAKPGIDVTGFVCVQVILPHFVQGVIQWPDPPIRKDRRRMASYAPDVGS